MAAPALSVSFLPSLAFRSEVMASGKVKWFEHKKGSGVSSQDSGPDIFVHHSSINGDGFKTLLEGEPVTFEYVPSEKGFKAEKVQRTRA